MGCKFGITYSGNLDNLYTLAIEEIKHYDAQYTGSKSGGTFIINVLGGTFEGRFIINGNTVDWEIKKKPFFIPCSLIENFLRNHIK